MVKLCLDLPSDLLFLIHSIHQASFNEAISPRMVISRTPSYFGNFLFGNLLKPSQNSNYGSECLLIRRPDHTLKMRNCSLGTCSPQCYIHYNALFYVSGRHSFTWLPSNPVLYWRWSSGALCSEEVSSTPSSASVQILSMFFLLLNVDAPTLSERRHESVIACESTF